MLPLACCRRWALFLLLAAAGTPASASEAARLLPAETDLVLTLNVRQLLEDHKKTEFIQAILEPWRLALRGDEKELRHYHQARELRKNAGIAKEDFLRRARTFRSLSDSLGLNPLEDVERVTCSLRISAPRSWIVLVEGRFKKKRFTSPDGANLALLNARTLAITGRKKEMDELRARAAGPRTGALGPGMRVLLEKVEREQVAFCLLHVDTLLKDGVKSALEPIVKFLGIDDKAIRKKIVDQVAAWAPEFGKDIACASVGLSARAEEVRLHVGLVPSKPAKVKDLATRIDRYRFLAALATKVMNGKLAEQLADILLRVGVARTREAVIVRAQVPYAFFQEVANELQTALNPALDRVWRQVASIPLWGPPKPPPGAPVVKEILDVAYRGDVAADPIRHRLDLFVPRGKKNCPVVILVHGGGWIMGDNRCCGLYTSVGHFLARQGFVAVLPNYRLAPGVKHPEQVKDVARAVRWTRDHIAAHGGGPDRMFLLGHSAGGHLVALLGTDASYLKAEGMSLRDIKGVISVSGVYRIAPGAVEAYLGGSGIRSFRPDQLFPLRGGADLPFLPPLGLPVKMDVYGPAFGADPKQRLAASPLSKVSRASPPFLLLISEKDLPTVPGMAEEFHQALRRAGCATQLLKVPNRNHNSLLFSAITPEDPVARAMLAFLRRHLPAK